MITDIASSQERRRPQAPLIGDHVDAIAKIQKRLNPDAWVDQWLEEKNMGKLPGAQESFMQVKLWARSYGEEWQRFMALKEPAVQHSLVSLEYNARAIEGAFKQLIKIASDHLETENGEVAKQLNQFLNSSLAPYVQYIKDATALAGNLFAIESLPDAKREEVQKRYEKRNGEMRDLCIERETSDGTTYTQLPQPPMKLREFHRKGESVEKPTPVDSTEKLFYREVALLAKLEANASRNLVRD